MRKLHCTVLLALLALAPAAAGAQAPAPGAAQFTVFLRGNPIGVEEVAVARSADGTIITGSSRLGPPLDVIVRRAEIRYDAAGKPASSFLEGSIRQRLFVISTTINGTTAVTDVTEGTSITRRSHQISPDAVVLPSVFFGGYEQLAARLSGMKPGEEAPVYVPGQGQIRTRLVSSNQERIRTADGTVKARRYQVTIVEPDKSVDAEVWADDGERLVRFSVAAQTLDVVRTDIASVSSRREAVARPGDEAVRMPANGFTLAGTLSRPTPGPAPRGVKLPSVILVGGMAATDRDETRAGVPVLGQLASQLADAGFLVLRYDRRGIGQSGGRDETAEIGDYAEDVRAVVRFMRKRKDVDRDRLAVLGYAEGGFVAMTAAAREGDIKALVLVATPGVKGSELVLEQQRAALARMDVPETEKQRRMELQRRINEAAVSGKGWEGVPPEMRKQAETPWFQSLLAFDPTVVMARVRQPVLVVQGSLDGELGASHGEALAAMARARKKAGEKVKLEVVPGVNHLLVPARDGTPDEYTSLAGAGVSAAVSEAVAVWLRETLPPSR